MPEEEIPEDSENEEDFEEESEDDEDEFIDEPDEEEEEKNIFSTPNLDGLLKNPELIINDEETKKRFESNQKIRNIFRDKENKTESKQIHPGFVASYSFGEHEYERLRLLLIRLDDVVEKVMTYREDAMSYFPEFYSILQNFFACIYFIVDSTNRKKIEEAFDYIREAVLNYTTKKELNSTAVSVLWEIYLLLSNVKNLHGLGFSYEKKKGESERYVDAFFKKKLR